MRTQQKGGKKREGNLPKPPSYFSFFRPLLSLLYTTIYIENNMPTFRCSSSTLLNAKKFFVSKRAEKVALHACA